MAELVPAPFADLVTRLFVEPQRQDTLFELPRKRWFVPSENGPDLAVRFHGRPAGNPLGPAAGPHTQMAQNILLSYVAGGRILELKTVQVDDRLTIGRPCIDLTNVGYNIEWSQELLVEQSLREYAAGAMLVHMFRLAHPAAAPALRGGAGDVLYDLSVGYDLKGIRSEKVRAFLRAMRDASAVIERLRGEIPGAFAAARGLDYPARLSDSITLSTFHGCPADEIERIGEFLIGEYDFDVIVKMNPPMLGKERLERLLFDELGYTELTVNPEAYRTGLSFDEGVQLCRRLSAFAAARGRRFGAKFSNTLEVLNHRDFFTPDNRIMYLSGQPLFVLTLTLTDEFRRALGPEFPISFSAGIDPFNFPPAVACGFVPITVSTDLLRPGGYGRMPAYLERLSAEMRKAGAGNIDEYILKWCPTRESDPGRGPADQGRGLAPAARTEPGRDPRRAGVDAASLSNTARAAQMAREDPRYRAAANRKVPKRIDSTLETFDCLTCDKCLPVCPNAANFTYPTPTVVFDYHDLVVAADGAWRSGTAGRFEISEAVQIACYADFCNECGNCDTFCPEYGGPYIKKPTFFGSVASWQRAAPRDGFVTARTARGGWIRGRIRGREYALSLDFSAGRLVFEDGAVAATFDGPPREPLAPADGLCLQSVRLLNGLSGEHELSLWVFHTMRHLFAGVHDPSRINQVNAADATGGTLADASRLVVASGAEAARRAAEPLAEVSRLADPRAGEDSPRGSGVVGVIPAAGRSRRMGRAKQTLDAGGRTMLRAVLDPILAGGAERAVVVTRSELAEEIGVDRLAGVVVAINDDPAGEMIDSVRIGLRAAEAGADGAAPLGFLVCPADHPGLAEDDVRRCVEAFRRGPDRIVIAAHGGRAGHPIIFPASLVAEVHSPACDGGLNGLRRAHAGRVVLVECASTAVVRDVDTPGDLSSGV